MGGKDASFFDSFEEVMKDEMMAMKWAFEVRDIPYPSLCIFPHEIYSTYVASSFLFLCFLGKITSCKRESRCHVCQTSTRDQQIAISKQSIWQIDATFEIFNITTGKNGVIVYRQDQEKQYVCLLFSVFFVFVIIYYCMCRFICFCDITKPQILYYW